MPSDDQPDTALRPEGTPPPEAAEGGDGEVVVSSGAPESAPHARRSHIVTAALLVTAVAAMVLLGVVLLGDRDDRREADVPTWSAWKPSKAGAAGAGQIARHVGRRYRQAGGAPLVLVSGGDMEIAGLPVTVAVRAPEPGAANLTRYPDAGVLYRLCGLGMDCAIATGAPSNERHLLLRREALELALYSLRYLDGVEQAVVLMPPRLGDQASQALFFRKGQLSDELTKPLEATLVDRAPAVTRVTKSPDALLVEQLTIPALFRFNLTQASKGDDALLVLEPFGAPGLQPAPSDPSRSGNGPGRSNASLPFTRSHPQGAAGGSGPGRGGVKPGHAATGARGYFG